MRPKGATESSRRFGSQLRQKRSQIPKLWLAKMSSFPPTAGGVGGVGDSKEPIRGASTNGVDSSSRLPSLSPPPTGPSSTTTSASKQGGHILNSSVASPSPSSSYRPGSLVVGGDSVGITINPLETASVRSASSGGNGNQVGFLLRHTFLFSPRPKFFFFSGLPSGPHVRSPPRRHFRRQRQQQQQ